MNAELEQKLFLKGKSRLPNILIASSECAPLSKTGGLGDMAGALPKSLRTLGFDARVITPYHRCIKGNYDDKIQHVCSIYVDLGWRHCYAGLEKMELDGTVIYLVDNEDYFGDAIYRGGAAEVEQYAFFQRAVLNLMPYLDFEPDVLHCNDWQTAMLPVLLKTQYAWQPQGRLKTVLTIHNLAFQGWLSGESATDLLGIDDRWKSDADGIGHGGWCNFLKGGCRFADKVNTVSPSYAEEICTQQFGEGLDGVLVLRGSDLSGIVNGIDTKSFDPAKDPNITAHFDAAHPEGKVKAKEALISELGLSIGTETPIVAMVTRMTRQKGFDLVLQSLDELMGRDVAFVLLGTGDKDYEDAMRFYEERYKGRLCAWLGYNEPVARKIYAGSDFFLMPSAFEPCGLSQMIAQHYGALPVVHAVGGLRDTVTPYNQFTGEGDGFSFEEYSRAALMGTLNFALDTYYDKPAMEKLIQTAMRRDVSLDSSALKYGQLYLEIVDDEPSHVLHLPGDEIYRNPMGAVPSGSQVRLRLRAADYADSVTLLLNGKEFPLKHIGDGLLEVTARAPAKPGVFYYSFRLAPGVYYGADGIGVTERQPWQLTVYDNAFTTPEWAEGTVMYQIFPDRYARGGDAFRKGVEYHRSLGRNVEIHDDWDEPVKYLPTIGPDYSPDDYFGGTLRGIIDSLPNLKELGIGCIYLNPIFEANSNHRYNTADYSKVDPMLGSEEDFKELCAKAKELGIHVILDGVFSHTGDDSVYFNKYARYTGKGAYQGPESPYYSWYEFRNFPDEYRCWWNFASLPDTIETDPEWQKFIITGRNSIMKRWLHDGASGWRLDVADELPDDVIDKMRKTLKKENPETLIIGEVWEDATTKVSYGELRRYALGAGLDSVMNYPLRSALLDFALGRCDAEALRDFLLRQKLNYPEPMYRCLMNLMGSHDTARLRTVLGSGWDGEGAGREEQAAYRLNWEQNLKGKKLQRLCAALQFALPGMPCIYYGDEEGMQGFRDPFCREPYHKGDGRSSLRSFYADLAKTRNNNIPLRKGDAAFASYGADVVAVLRWAEGKATLVGVNRSAEACTIIPKLSDFRGLSLDAAAKVGILNELQIPPTDFVITNM